MRTRLLLTCLVFVVVAALAAAQDDPASGRAEREEEARQRFHLAELYYSQARFAEAAAEFEAAYAALPHPTLLHNIYLARRDMGDLAGATEALTRYLADATDLTANDRRLLEARLAAMRRQLAQMHPTDEPPAHDTEPATTEQGHPEENTSEQDTPAGDLDAPEITAAPDPAPGDDGGTHGGIGLVPGVIVLGVGVATIIAGAIAAGLAEGVRGERDSMCTLTRSGGTCPSSLDQLAYASRFATDRDAAWGLFIAGGAVAIAGAVLLAVGAGEPSGAPSVSAACDGTGCLGSVAGTF
jgi:hypothetical protein